MPGFQILLLDGKAQSAEADEYVYHELLVHPAMLLHPNPKTVFVAGGKPNAYLTQCIISAGKSPLLQLML